MIFFFHYLLRFCYSNVDWLSVRIMTACIWLVERFFAVVVILLDVVKRHLGICRNHFIIISHWRWNWKRFQFQFCGRIIWKMEFDREKTNPTIYVSIVPLIVRRSIFSFSKFKTKEVENKSQLLYHNSMQTLISFEFRFAIIKDFQCA